MVDGWVDRWVGGGMDGWILKPQTCKQPLSDRETRAGAGKPPSETGSGRGLKPPIKTALLLIHTPK